MEIMPDMHTGWINGWILLAVFFVAYGAMLLFFPKNVMSRLYDRSGQAKRQGIRGILVVIIVLVWFMMVCFTPLKVGSAVFFIGIPVYTLGLIGFLIALENFKRAPTGQPATAGLYKISRHPQQFSISLTFLGIAVAIGSWLALSCMILFMIGAHKKILAEEAACLEQYGEDYRSYMERIPRYFLFF